MNHCRSFAPRRRAVFPASADKPTKLAPGLWLLYGPSVDQVFRSVASEEAPEAARFLEAEFNRLMDL